MANRKPIKYIEDDKYYNEVQALYANVLDASGFNIKDPLRAITNTFFKEQRKQLVDPPYVGKTYIFVTRPDLNFEYVKNVKNVALFDYMAETELGKQLMTLLMYPEGWYDEDGDKVIRSSIGGRTIEKKYKVKSPFIPLITNTCVNSSGGKDVNIDTYETEGDFHGNRLVYAAGADESFTVTEQSLEFNDVYNSAVMHLINLWAMYIYYYCKGVIDTRWKYKAKRILDYTSSIYVFMTGKDHTTIERWSKSTGCFPKVVPTSIIQHSSEPNSEALRNLSISFACNRFDPMTPKVFGDFNKINQPFLRKGYGIDFPDPMFVPERDFDLKVEEFLLKRKNQLSPPIKETGDKGSYSIITKDDYDNQFFGKTPYIVKGQLRWLSLDKPIKLNDKFNYDNWEKDKRKTFEGKLQAMRDGEYADKRDLESRLREDLRI